VFYLVPIIIVLGACLAGIEVYLRHLGFGDPPLYQSDPAIGYVLKPSQSSTRLHGCRVVVNSLGMRSDEVTRQKPPNMVRVLVLGDSVPYGGSYIDQADTFCAVAQRILNRKGDHYQVLNAALNAWGPQNIIKYLEKRGTYEADMVIVYLPWGDLNRSFANFHIVPFWSNSPGWALAEFFRHGVWTLFGKCSGRWKSGGPSSGSEILELNLNALKNIRAYCGNKGTPVYFFWSPSKRVVQGRIPDGLTVEKERFYEIIPREITVDMEPLFRKSRNIETLFKDDCHYSQKGHRMVGEALADFISTRHKR